MLGIDEFAFREGATYGTVLIDVETHRPIDLLPDRTAGTVISWLTDHPDIEVVCRDRSSTFSQAAARAAPDAIQVACRWHLLHSLARAVERTAHQHRSCLRKDAETDQPQEPSDPASLATLIGPPDPSDPPDGQLLARVHQWHSDIHQLRERGWTISRIADRLGRDRKTVRHYLTTDLDQILVSARERRPNGHINRFKPYLQHSFRGGATNASALFREIRERGYRGSRVVVTKYIATLRAGTAVPEPARPIPSPRRITTWIVRHPDALTESQRDQLDSILDACPDRPPPATSPTSSAPLPENAEVRSSQAGWSEPSTRAPHRSGASPLSSRTTGTLSSTASPCPGAPAPSKARSRASSTPTGARAWR